MKHFYSLLFVLPLLFISMKVDASHAAGGELSYEHISGNTYRFTFKFFRDCTGVSEPTSVPLCIYNLCSNTNVTTIFLPKIVGNIPGTGTANGTPTSSGCPGFQTSCQNPSSPVEGYSEWWYQGTYTLPAPGVTCDQWRFNTYIGARNPSTNITGGSFYVEAFLNRRPVPNAPSINNNSPYFTAAPIPYYCANQPTTFNNGMVELDGDSTTFSSIQPQNQSGCNHTTPSNSTYTNGSYNPTTNPFNTGNSFNINPTNGSISFTPIGQQTPTITVRVNEYRNGVLIGYVMRDIQMVILNCTTPNPTFAIDTNTISGGSQNANVIDLCHGQNFNVCFDVISSSATALISMSDNSQQITPTATMSYQGVGTDSVVGCYSWTPTLADTGLHIITITATDSSCAPPGILISQTFTMALNVSQSFPMSVSSTNPLCGNNNGTITASSPGASSFTLQPSNTTSSNGLFTGLGSGIYTVSVSNGGVCAIPQTISLQPPTNMTWSNVLANNPTCSPATSGSINALVSGGQGTVTYGITPPVATNNTTGNFANLIAGTYTISATDALNCTINTQVTLVAPVPLTLSTPTVGHTSCPALNNGTIATSVMNSSNPPVTYTISPGMTSNTTGSFTGLTAGSYTITAIDAAGCSGSTVASINNPLLPSITNVSAVQPNCNTIFGSISVSAFAVFNPLTYTLNPGNQSNQTGSFFLLTGNTYTVTVTDPGNCAVSTNVVLNVGGTLQVTAVPLAAGCGSSTGSISTTVIGGNPSFSYNLQPGNITNATGNFSGLAGGNYVVTVTDASNCTGTSNVTINVGALPTWSSHSFGSPNCNSGSGWVSATATSPSSPMTYSLMPVNQTNGTGNFTNLAAGNYILTATDANNCDTTSNFMIVVPPQVIWDSTSEVNVSCNGGSDGSLQVSASGGTGTMTYLLNPGNQSNTSGTYTTLSQGVYTITATDANNCSISTSITISEPPALVWGTQQLTDVSCNGGNDGSITQPASGGTSPITYNLLPGNVNNSTGTFTGLPQGTYTITITDGNNCTLSTTVSITEPPLLSITNISSTTPSCVPGNDGSITVNANGGTPAYQYNIGGGNQSSNVFNNVGSGVYVVTVTDANNCTVSTSVSIVAPNAPNITNSSNVNVSCNGGNDGSISITSTGGTSPITYNLLPGNVSNSTGTFTNLSQGNYTVTVTDAIGCSASTTIGITEPPQVVWDSTSEVNVSCNGGNDGSLQVSASGGSGTMTYLLNPGNQSNTSGTYTTLSQGVYTITATDANNCSISTSITISEPPALVWGTQQLTDVSCNGGNDGSITQPASGGTSPITYNLLPGNVNNSTGTFTGLPQGTYTITITDGNNCTLSTTVSITEPPLLSITNISSTTPSCVPGNDGSITVNANGGTPAYQYNIGGGNQSSNVFNNVGSGVYVVTVTDANNCTVSTSVSIVAPNAPNITNSSNVNVSCNGGNDGSISITSTGGTSPITYNLLPGNVSNSTGTFTNLSQGNYTVTVTDAIGCSASTTIGITEPTQVVWDSTSQVNVSCNGGSDGSLQVSASGGTGTMTYLLNPGNQSNTSGTYTTLSQGVYTITATDANNCSISTSITISEPPALVWGTQQLTDVSCNGGNDGSITQPASGGTSPITYNLLPGNVNNSTGTFTGLTQGTYTITITDGNNCTLSTTVSITEPPLLSITNISSTTPSCVPGNDGSITVNANGGTPAYQYNIGGGNQSSNVFNNVGSGVYVVTVTDANNCTVSTSVSIVAPNAPNITNSSNVNVSCNGGNDGSISITSTGGTSPITYNLLPGNVSNSTGTFTNLSQGNYTVTVTDAIGCSASTTIGITEPPQVVWDSTSQVNVSCNGGNDGSLQVSASGGTGTMTYLLNPGNQSNTSGTYTTLSQGVYTITATDANNCSISTSITISEPPALVWGTQQLTDVSCNGGNDGSITQPASGGTSPITYNLLPGNVNNSTGTFTGLTQGTYTITITDGNNCTLSTTVSITEPPLLSITNISSTTPSCVPGNDGSITVNANGGTPAYQYNIGGGNQSSNVFNNVGSGVYVVTVTDANNCTVSTSVSIVAPNAPNITNSSNVNVSCNGGNDGSISITSTGGTSPITYNLLPGNVSNSTGTFTNLSQGNYTVTVTDAIGCSASTTIGITEPPQVIWDSTSEVNVSCNGGSDGSLQVSASGGSGTMTYLLNPGNQSNTSGTYTTLSQGVYTITATDANNCSISTSITISEPPALVWGTQQLTDVSCNGGNDGSITQPASGGTSPITYNLLPGNVNNSTGTFTGLTQGTYTITITDGNNCTLSTTVSITEPPLLSITNISSTTPSCVPGNDGSITVNANGGTPAYQYNIGGGNQSSNVFNNVGSGVYVVTVTDANNCTVSTSVSVVTANSPMVTNLATTAASCIPGNDGSVTVTASGGLPPYQYSSGGANQVSNVLINLAAGSFTITVTDGNGCTATSIATISTEPSPSIDSVSVTDASCNPGCDGTAMISASGGTNPVYTYSIGGPSQNGNLFNNLCTGMYVASVQDGNGCTDTMMFTISTANGPTITAIVADSVNCNGDSNGGITVSSTGGALPISYNLNPGNITNATGVFQGLSANSYSISVSDANGCTITTLVDVYEPAPVIFDSVSGSGSSCSGSSNGTIFVSNVGGTGNFTYQINPAATFTPPGTFSNLQGNLSYSITASDANGCTLTTTIFISSPQAMSITNTTTTAVSCNGANDGTAQAVVTGGTTPYAYNIMPTNITNNNGNFTGLGGGAYTVTITDANNCTISTIVNVAEPAALQFTNVTVTDVSCAFDTNGSIQVTAAGGVPTLSFDLMPGNVTNLTGGFANLWGATYTVTITDANNCTFSSAIVVNEPDPLFIDSLVPMHVSCSGADDGQISVSTSGGNGSNSYNLQPLNVTNTSGVFTNLIPQQYVITVTDINNCSATDSILITEPYPLTASQVATNVTCFGGNNGTISITPTGGSPAYTYTLTPGNIVSTTGQYVGLTAGVYSVTVVDANNCSTIVNGIPVTQPSQLLIDSMQIEDVRCFGDNTGRVMVYASGGIPQYIYTLTPAGGAQNSPGDFTDMYAGSYVVTVTDANNCTVTSIANVHQNPEIVFDTITLIHPLCHGDDNGSIEINASGGRGTIAYSLNNGPFTTKRIYQNLVADYYLISAQDSLNCRVDSGLLLVQPDPVEVETIDLTHLSCSDAKDGTAIVTASGGVGYYTFYVRPGIRWNRTGSFYDLDKGYYSIKVVDTNQCEADSFFTILQNPNPMFSTITKRNLSCHGYGDEGEAEVDILGGVEPLTYLWSTTPPQQTKKITELRFGWYYVDVVDAKGCNISDSVYINPGDCCSELFLPNAFSPNGDGNNDEFRVITSAGVELLQFEIYNRWGQRVWDTYTYYDGWDGDFRGEHSAPGTYHYIYRYRCITDGKLYIKKGDIILIR